MKMSDAILNGIAYAPYQAYAIGFYNQSNCKELRACILGTAYLGYLDKPCNNLDILKKPILYTELEDLFKSTFRELEDVIQPIYSDDINWLIMCCATHNHGEVVTLYSFCFYLNNIQKKDRSEIASILKLMGY